MTRSRRGEVLLVLCSILFFLGFAEAALRLTGLGAPRPTGYAPVDTRRRGMAPTNALGYRDLDHAVPKPPGVRRLLSLGDSFAWGASIEFDDTYAQRVGRALNRRRAGESWEVIQLSLPGMNTVEQASQLVEEGFAYGPDVVVVGFVLNDSEDENAAEERRARDWVEEKRERKSRVRRFLNRSLLYRLVTGRIYATIENRRRTTAYVSQFAPDYPGWVACQKALKLMGSVCRERGVPLVVMIFPLFGQPLDASYPFAGLHAKVAHAAGEAGARVVDLLPVYRGLRWDVLVVDGVDDEHPNEIGHRLAAGALLRALDDVLPGASVPSPAPAATPSPSAGAP
ncbi:MAG TPA: SGNH/GDSL hydrolase family protein [Vicinamibacteria bacterium]|nr:SGNH/GDSL hydrolase family protein [Vicinamibacteria bacterium]